MNICVTEDSLKAIHNVPPPILSSDASLTFLSKDADCFSRRLCLNIQG